MLNVDISFSAARRQPWLINVWFCFVLSDELRQLRTEKEDLQKETECWKAEQIKERDQEKWQHKCVPVGIQAFPDICSICVCLLLD